MVKGNKMEKQELKLSAQALVCIVKLFQQGLLSGLDISQLMRDLTFVADENGELVVTDFAVTVDPTEK